MCRSAYEPASGRFECASRATNSPSKRTPGPLHFLAGYAAYRPVTADGEVFGPTQTVASPNAKAVAMRRLLPLAALVFALWAIDAYAFHSRYWAAASEDVDYYAKILNDGVHGLMRRLNP